MSRRKADDIGEITLTYTTTTDGQNISKKIFVPRYKLLMTPDDTFNPGLKRYIGKENTSNTEWIKNAQELFLNQQHVKTFLNTVEGREIRMQEAGPNPGGGPWTAPIIRNALFILNNVYFARGRPFLYKGEQWHIDNLAYSRCPPNTICQDGCYFEWKIETDTGDNIQNIATIEKKKRDELNKAYKPQIDQVNQLPDSNQFEKEWKTQQITELRTQIQTQFTTWRTGADFTTALEQAQIDKRHNIQEKSPVICKFTLTLRAKRSILTPKKNLMDYIKKVKTECRSKGSRSIRMNKVVSTCDDLCRTNPDRGWCKACSLLVDCEIRPQINSRTTETNSSVTASGINSSAAAIGSSAVPTSSAAQTSSAANAGLIMPGGRKKRTGGSTRKKIIIR